jgi:hypothetical protein
MNLKKNARRLITSNQGIIIAIVLYLLVGYINEFFATNQVYWMVNQKPLFDRGFNLIPQIPYHYADFLLIILAVYFIMRWGIKNVQIIENYLWIITILFIGRVLAFSSTQIPPAVEGCKSRKATDSITWFVGPKRDECMDYMYSGHTIHAVLIALFVLFLSNSKIEKVIIVLLVIIELFFIIGSHMHYTADVIIGTTVTVLMFFAWPGIDSVFDWTNGIMDWLKPL